MSTRALFRTTLALVLTLLLSATAHAQLFRAYISSKGSDVNNCSLQTPCRLLPAALAAVTSGGEIWILDSANYNTATVTIGKSVSILAVPGAIGSVVATGGPAISITAANLTIALRNLVIVPLTGAGATYGINITGASLVTVEDSLIANLPNDGITVHGTGTLKVANTTIRNNGGFGVSAINGAQASVVGTQLLSNGDGGLLADGFFASQTTMTASDVHISGGDIGVAAYGDVAGAKSSVYMTRSSVDNMATGLRASTYVNSGTAIVSVSSSLISNNGNGWYAYGGGAIESLGNNHILHNASNYGSLTNVGLQ